MATIQFYHLTATPLDRALPRLLEKIVGSGFKVALTVASDEHAEALDQWLWTYDPGSFLAHGVSKNGNAEAQPILISTDASADNGANLLFITDGRSLEGNFERVVDMFDGRDETAVAKARERWTAYKNSEHTISYFKQTDSGGWEKAASNG